jgi:hypothetical protein
MTIKNKIQLITYTDSFGANLPELHIVQLIYLQHSKKMSFLPGGR